jgi:hypothetical protein
MKKMLRDTYTYLTGNSTDDREKYMDWLEDMLVLTIDATVRMEIEPESREIFNRFLEEEDGYKTH